MRHPRKSDALLTLLFKNQWEKSDNFLTTFNREKYRQSRINQENKDTKKALKTLNKSAFSRLFVMAGAEGLEPTTHGFGDQYSTN